MYRVAVVPRHEFSAYPALTKSCIYARKHTVRTPLYLEKATRKKVPSKSYKNAITLYSFEKKFGKEKATNKNKDSQKLQKQFKARLFLITITIIKRKGNYNIVLNYGCINILVVPRHQFPAYLTLTKSCIYARNHTVRTPPYLEKQPAKQKASTKSYKNASNQYSFQRKLERKKQPANTKIHQSYKNALNQYFLKRNLERKKLLQ